MTLSNVTSASAMTVDDLIEAARQEHLAIDAKIDALRQERRVINAEIKELAARKMRASRIIRAANGPRRKVKVDGSQ